VVYVGITQEYENRSGQGCDRVEFDIMHIHILCIRICIHIYTYVYIYTYIYLYIYTNI